MYSPGPPVTPADAERCRELVSTLPHWSPSLKRQTTKPALTTGKTATEEEQKPALTTSKTATEEEHKTKLN